MAINKDCFAYRTSEYCSALNKMICKNGKCSFYKSKQQHIEDREKYGAGENYGEVYRKKHEG